MISSAPVIQALRTAPVQGERLFVNVGTAQELDAWARHFRTSRERVVEVVGRVGPFVTDVEQALDGQTYAYD